MLLSSTFSAKKSIVESFPCLISLGVLFQSINLQPLEVYQWFGKEVIYRRYVNEELEPVEEVERQVRNLSAHRLA
jgi:hypothetical protein